MENDRVFYVAHFDRSIFVYRLFQPFGNIFSSVIFRMIMTIRLLGLTGHLELSAIFEVSHRLTIFTGSIIIGRRPERSTFLFQLIGHFQ